MDFKDEYKPSLTSILWKMLEGNAFTAMEMTTVLMLGADVNDCTEDGSTLLHRAAISKNSVAVKLLLVSGAEVDKQNNNGTTALRAAASSYFHSGDNASKVIMEHLLFAGASPNQSFRSGGTFLHHAIENASSWMIDLLLNYMADPEVKNSSGETAIDISSGEVRARLERIVLERNINDDFCSGSSGQALGL